MAAREKDGKTGRALASAEGHAALLAKLEEWHVPELDSDKSAMAIERIEISVEKVERVQK